MAIRPSYFSILFFLAVIHLGKAQNFGSSYDFLIKESNARTAALGGVTNSLADEDVNMVFSNPAVANARMSKSLGLTFNPSFGSIYQYNVAYADSSEKLGNLFGTLQYLDYGKLKKTDETGYDLGTFNASQYALAVGTSRKREISNSVQRSNLLAFRPMCISQLRWP